VGDAHGWWEQLGAGFWVFPPDFEFMKDFMHGSGARTAVVPPLTVPQSNWAEGGDAEGFELVVCSWRAELSLGSGCE